MNPDLSSLDEQQLLQAACDGDENALGLLLFRMQPTLLASIRPQLGHKLKRVANEDDVLQETYRRAFTDFSKADFIRDDSAAIEPFVRWLQQIAANSARQAGREANAQKRGGDFQRIESLPDAFRDKARDLLTELSTGDATVSQFAARAEAGEALRIAIAGLPADQQRVIRLRYFEQCSVEQMAEKLDRSTGSIRGLLDRARAALRVSMHNSALWLSRRD
ncbi:MAG: sigma-70 family RNA polymerase sigma factor [Planctomycetota bacterium]